MNRLMDSMAIGIRSGRGECDVTRRDWRPGISGAQHGTQHVRPSGLQAIGVRTEFQNGIATTASLFENRPDKITAGASIPCYDHAYV